MYKYTQEEKQQKAPTRAGEGQNPPPFFLPAVVFSGKAKNKEDNTNCIVTRTTRSLFFSWYLKNKNKNK